jgi:hypothetical protein
MYLILHIIKREKLICVRTCRKEYQYKEILDSLDITLTEAEIGLIIAASKGCPPKRVYARKVWQDADNEGVLR